MQLPWKTYGWSKYIKDDSFKTAHRKKLSKCSEGSKSFEGRNRYQEASLVKQHNRERSKRISSPSVFNEKD